jgi:hypothetical protein
LWLGPVYRLHLIRARRRGFVKVNGDGFEELREALLRSFRNWLFGIGTILLHRITIFLGITFVIASRGLEVVIIIQQPTLDPNLVSAGARGAGWDAVLSRRVLPGLTVHCVRDPDAHCPVFLDCFADRVLNIQPLTDDGGI